MLLFTQSGFKLFVCAKRVIIMTRKGEAKAQCARGEVSAEEAGTGRERTGALAVLRPWEGTYL